MGHLINTINAVTGADDAFFRQVCGTAGTFQQSLMRTHNRDLAKTRLLICDLAIRAYSLEHGRNPAKLTDLVPDYLPEVPKDPFGSGQILYRLAPNGYLLYSVGVDGLDDGGRNSGPTALEESGDILLDDPPGPPVRPAPASP
jgi:hypothetical protein